VFRLICTVLNFSSEEANLKEMMSCMPATADQKKKKKKRKIGDEWDNHVTVMRNHIDMVSVILFSPCFLEGMAGISP